MDELKDQLDETDNKINELLGMISVVAKGKAKISIDQTKEGTQVSISKAENANNQQ